MRVGYINASISEGSGRVSLGKAFRDQYPLWQMDVLQDLIAHLEEEYRMAKEAHRAEMELHRKGKQK